MELPVSSSALPLVKSPEDSLSGKTSEKANERLHEAAEAFEGAFLKILLKSMRDTIPEGGLFDRQQMAAFEEMRDGAMADSLSSRGATGIAQMVIRQLGGTPKETVALNTSIIGERPAQVKNASASPASNSIPTAANAQSQRNFVDQLMPAARKAAKALGIDAAVIVAQAALETGWGHHVPKNADGASSNNMFGVKAGGRWNGEVTQQRTTEFLGGKLRNVVAQFRAYTSSADSVADYVDLISGSDRYAPALNAKTPGEYLQALTDGGYATDPNYAKKIQSILQSPELSPAHAD